MGTPLTARNLDLLDPRKNKESEDRVNKRKSNKRKSIKKNKKNGQLFLVHLSMTWDVTIVQQHIDTQTLWWTRSPVTRKTIGTDSKSEARHYEGITMTLVGSWDIIRKKRQAQHLFTKAIEFQWNVRAHYQIRLPSKRMRWSWVTTYYVTYSCQKE